MSTLMKNIIVPENRHVTIVLPDDASAGDIANIVVTITKPETRPVEKKQIRSILDFAGIFANSKTFAGDSVALIREMRDEW